MSKPNKIQYNGNSKIIAALVNVGNWLLDNGAYTLPIASASRLGGIKVGQNLTITEEGVLNAQAGGGSDVSVTPIVTTGTKIAKITITEGTSDTDYNLFAPTPSTVNDATITIKKNNTTVDSFTLNQSSNKDINISVPTVTDSYDGTSSDGMSGKAVKSAIDALDVTTSGAAASKTVTALSQTDGKISATFSDISITKSQVSDFPAIPTKVSDLTNDSGYVTTDEKVTAESVDPSSGSYVGLCVPLVYKEDNQKPKIPTGHVMNVKKGTSSEVGYVSVTLGNSTASGTSGNKFGRLRLYSQKTKCVDLVTTADMTTADRTVALPDADGTLALTSDIPTKTSDLTNDSGFVTTDEKVTCESVSPTTETTYDLILIPHSTNTTNQKPKINTSFVIYLKKGTTSAVGYNYLQLGNAIKSGTNENQYGALRLYSQASTKRVDLRTLVTITSDRVIYLPDKDGTIALTKDLTTYAFAQGDNNGEIKITPYVGGTAGTPVTVKPKGISDLAYIAKGSGSSKFLREDGTWQTVTASWSGGQVTSDIYPNAQSSLNLGLPTRYFKESYTVTAFSNTLVLGYSGGVTGRLCFCREDASCVVNITPPSLNDADVALTLPSASGTLATQEWLTGRMSLFGKSIYNNGSRYCRIKSGIGFGSYSRAQYFVFTVAGGTIRAAIVGLMTSGGTPSIQIKNLGNANFSGSVTSTGSSTKTLTAVLDFGGGVYDTTNVIGNDNFTLAN